MLEEIKNKKEKLDALRPFSQEVLAELDAWYDVELTYTSNAIEGNTLSRQETALVLEKGLTVRGKPLKDHQEAVDHLDALRLVRELVEQDHPITEGNVRDIHRLVVGRTLKTEAGVYSQHRRRIAGSMVVFPNPVKIPGLMKEFGNWLSQSKPSAETALEAHLRLVSIHPFSDGNGRSARLLMNLILMKDGYPPMVIRPEDRPDYLDGIEEYQLHQETSDYRAFMLGRLNASLDDYLRFLEPGENPGKKFDGPAGP